jgi:hypothetical protein
VGHFDFRITEYTTDQEVQKFARLVKDEGTDALRRAPEKEDKGRIMLSDPPALKSPSHANASMDTTPSLLLLPLAACLR